VNRRDALSSGLTSLTGLAGLTVSVAAGAATPTMEPGTAKVDVDALRLQVIDTETAFARTMAERNFAGFLSFVDDDAVFLNGGDPLRGKAAIGAHWQKFYTARTAPFSWRPDLVEVLATGALAQSNGPVTDPSGKVFARFYSTWRLESPGVWRIVFDNGYAVCD
jgi:ketosteroid isomerase-like protein